MMTGFFIILFKRIAIVFLSVHKNKKKYMKPPEKPAITLEDDDFRYKDTTAFFIFIQVTLFSLKDKKYIDHSAYRDHLL